MIRWLIGPWFKAHRPHFFTNELQSDMKIWHHFIYARLVPIAYLTEVTREEAFLLYDIKNGLSINVGHWSSANIRHGAQNMPLGMHPTLVTELIVATSLSTIGQEILQPKNPLNRKAIDRIMRVDEGGDEAGTGSSKGDWGGVCSSSRPTIQTKATLADLARIVDRQEDEMQGLKYWLMQKAVHDHSSARRYVPDSTR